VRLPHIPMTRRSLILVVLITLASKGISILLAHPSGPRTWRLPDGTIVHFHIGPHTPPGRDSIKYLELTPPGGKTKTFRFAETHAGYDHVDLRIDFDYETIWIVDRDTQRVGCSLDLKTGTFVGESWIHPPGVGIYQGLDVEPYLPRAYNKNIKREL
jgi:hypothetical protein